MLADERCVNAVEIQACPSVCDFAFRLERRAVDWVAGEIKALFEKVQPSIRPEQNGIEITLILGRE